MPFKHVSLEKPELSLHILDSLLEGFQVIDFQWTYLYVNQTVANQARVKVDELIGKTMMECFPGIEDSHLFKRLRKCMNERVVLHFENEFTFENQDVEWYELRVQPVDEGIIIFSTNITERKKAERELLALKKSLEMKVRQRTRELIQLNAEKDVILKEMHHRVKNNLQIVSSLIRLQMDDKNPRLNEVLSKTQTRIETIASIHESLYKFRDLALIDVAVYWRKLFSDCMHSMISDPTKFSLKLNFKDIYFPVDRMIPLGLLINELITNSIVHGFKGCKEGEVELGLCEVGSNYLLTYKDNGVGFDPDAYPHTENNFGHFLIAGFAEQLNGCIAWQRPARGVRFELTFPQESC